MRSYQYITSNRAILGGKPIVKGTRISVDLILEWNATGATIEQISNDFPQLSIEAIREAIRYASDYLKNEIVIETEVA
jgi:uncharacterized protein (DUF433 family)